MVCRTKHFSQSEDISAQVEGDRGETQTTYELTLASVGLSGDESNDVQGNSLSAGYNRQEIE